MPLEIHIDMPTSMLTLNYPATPTEGIFRLSGSAKRIKELQAIFDSPPSYGKTLTWLGYSVHDAANVLRRYLNNLPDPVIPHQWYEPFRRALGKIYACVC